MDSHGRPGRLAQRSECCRNTGWASALNKLSHPSDAQARLQDMGVTVCRNWHWSDVYSSSTVTFTHFQSFFRPIREIGVSFMKGSLDSSCNIQLQVILCLSTQWPHGLQAALSTGLPRQEYWSGLPFPLPGDLPNPGVKLTPPALTGGSFTTESPRKPTPQTYTKLYLNYIISPSSLEEKNGPGLVSSPCCGEQRLLVH